MKLYEFKNISYDTDIELLGMHNCNVIGDYSGFISIPQKYNNCNVIYIATNNNTLIIQIDK